MKRRLLYIAATLFIGLGISAQTQADFNRVIMQAYSDMLRENYKDYETLFRRANTYYNSGDYLKAMDDLDSALKYCPESDSDSRFAIYALRSECYVQLKRYSRALPEADEALKLDPTSAPMIALRGRIELELGKYDAAKADYNKLLRLQPRSTDALFGLATVAAKQQNIGTATDYMDQAVNLTPNSSVVYVRRTNVKKLIGDYNGAVDDLLLAMATDANDPDALPELVRLADSNYSAVITGLTGAIRQAPRNPLYYYLRASIAAAHFHYGAAIDDFNYIIKEKLYDYAGLYCSLAECYFALGKYAMALDNSEQALANYDAQTDDVSHYFTVYATILRAMGQTDKALTAIDRAIDFNQDDVDALTEKSLILVDLKKYDDASALLGEIIMSNPYEPMPYMLRAWVLNDFLNQPTAAKNLYNRVIDLELDHSELVGSMLGFAQLFAGLTPRATAWMDAILAEPDYDGKNHYYGACFYAWAGRTDKALDCAEKALKAGYANYYNWTDNNSARINVAPLRDNARFKALLEQYKSIFAI
ncbi:MAG: tetratricopeptide repeat protein [Bacteroides sp.]|nr:tetratricopeptide repeat protein [Bacteroides sp.]MCM1379354.1 tetratricopeptide repeat protein [Bacteroides sp.]MCM1445214.1 tetratricopeptide repeat protein [Prevotella sp.]